MADFKVGTHDYRSRKLSAMEQFHVMRRLAGVLTKLGSSTVRNVVAPPEGQTGENSPTMMDLVGPMLEAIGEMTDEECNYVFAKCLGVVDRGTGTPGGSLTWSPLWNTRANMLQYQDLSLSEMVEIMMQVLGDNLGNTLGAPAWTSSLLNQKA